MNKAITDGLVLMPPPFSAGLGVWSSGNGRPGDPVYDGAPNAAFVPADADFGGCLELQKTQATQRLRWTGEVPVLPGCYLRVTVRIKAMLGNLPSVRIAAWAGTAGGSAVTGIPLTGPSVALTEYGRVFTVSAIIGTGSRGGVDMPWGLQPAFGHFGLDLTGPTGGVVRIDDIEIEDITSAFLRDMMDWVDVRDYGAVGDGVANDRAAFIAADQAATAAGGRSLLVPEGTYFIGSNLTLNAPVRFEGHLSMALTTRLLLTRSYDYPTYVAAFGGDQDLGFRKALQALFYFTDHVELDLRGRRVRLTAPVNVRALVPEIDFFAIRRLLRNGQLEAVAGAAWDTQTLTRTATYNPAQPKTLTGVSNVAAIPVGSLVSGTGVGREVYVTAKNAGAGTLTLSQPLYGATGTQSYTLQRFCYLLDFSGIDQLDKFEIENVHFQCDGHSSAIMLAPSGMTFRLANSVINRPKDRGITSIGIGCQDLFIEDSHFLSNEMPLRAQDRTSVAVNFNANDVKVRNNRFAMFGHTFVAHGTGHQFIGNHFFQGDKEPQGVRQAGLILTQPNTRTILTGNYVDNCWIEWTNEHSANPVWNNEFSFGGMTVTANIFTTIGVAAWFRWFVIKPYGSGHFIHGLNLSANVFRTFHGVIDRVEHIDTTFADIDRSRTRNLIVEGNAFNGVTQLTMNPLPIQHDQNTAAATWTINSANFLPFGCWARRAISVLPEGPLRDGSNAIVHAAPYAQMEQGPNNDQIALVWPQPLRGRVQVVMRADNPL